jgi:glycosyltransferase involved in cell wall biosynthesis
MGNMESNEMTKAPGSRPIRVLQVFNQYLEQGGEEVWVNEVAKFSGRLFRVNDLRFQSSEWMGRGAPTLFRQARQVWDNPESRARLRAAVDNVRPDVLLYHNLIPVGSLGLYDEAHDLGLPVVQYIHNFRPFSASGTMWVRGRVNPAGLRGNPWPEVLGRAWERSFLKTFLVASYQSKLVSSGTLDVVRRWIAVSEFMRERFIEAGIAADRVVTLRHCWHPRAKPDPDKMSGHYLFLGRLVAEKGIFTLLQAWTILETRLGHECPRLVIAGSGPAEALVHTMVSRMRSVVCVGFVEGKTKDDLLHGCRALIAPSIWWEPLGLIVYEAYDFGRPVLAAASGGLMETVVEGETGFLHEPGNAIALANDVEKMEQQGAEGRVKMGENGRNWLLENASPATWLQRFSEIMTGARNSS